MPIRFDQKEACQFLLEQAGLASAGTADADWIAKVGRLSELCEAANAKTHIAFLGTALLANALNQAVDLYAIKPNHAPDRPNAFSARVLAEKVLVPVSAEAGFSLGVTGRQPLNNQPYFRMTALDDGTPVHGGAQVAFNYMLELVKELQQLNDPEVAAAALRSYVVVRRQYQPRYDDLDGVATSSPVALLDAVEALVGARSEGGRRAQAVAAGLLDVFAGVPRVDSGRINDPDRRNPGDVCVFAIDDEQAIEKAFEVRDKPVSEADVRIFVRKCLEVGVREASVLMVGANQPLLDYRSLSAWAGEYGVGVTVFHGWATFLNQALFWSAQPTPVAVSDAVHRINARLVEVEASAEAVQRWQELTNRRE